MQCGTGTTSGSSLASGGKEGDVEVPFQTGQESLDEAGKERQPPPWRTLGAEPQCAEPVEFLVPRDWR